MADFRILEIKKSVFDDNNRQADALRAELRKNGTFLLNLMSSPGSGKTTTIIRTIEALKNDFRIGIVEADVDSDVDARMVFQTGVKVVQVHTGGMCHMDAAMMQQGVLGLETADLDLIILENIGNLLCPAEFDTGAAKNAMILSVPEGDDKPLKYPSMFSMVDVLLINKIDAKDFFNFDLDAAMERVRNLNPDVSIFPISAKTGQGMDAWTDWLRQAVSQWKKIH
ncbi:MAG TPA: hydrogenase nickel incorporation protein HypB [Anaerolineaceae bacterium]|nr:hydrogenase nickel incorporation protein HypB [Anaerolineaceae bacterium]HPN51704.1 hydrogenase nickel incorporation protein HypB [Anaerolineaceae bacterium]